MISLKIIDFASAIRGGMDFTPKNDDIYCRMMDFTPKNDQFCSWF